MALPILDGNQSATTLSSILTSGEHIPAHTVVSLGTQAITDISAAVSGSVVSISNFPATQPVSIASVTIGNSVTIGSLPLIAGTVSIGNLGDGITTLWSDNAVNDIQFAVINGLRDYVAEEGIFPTSGTVTIGNSVTIASLPALVAGTAQIGSVTASISSFATSVTARLINPAGTAVTYAEVGTAGSPSIDVLSVQGVTSGTAIPISISSVTIGALPAISGTVTANLAISSTVITSGSFTSLTSATLVPANPARKMATVYNLGAGQLFVNAGATATTLGGGFMVALSSGDFYECDYTTTTLSAIFATAGTASWMSH